ncbi:MAG: ATP-binding cassette domain-containing protein [Candidatus Enteromonas sp.]|nr:ATP-binding cassette domain-containing protein [Candidatus Enteromonas sp.]
MKKSDVSPKNLANSAKKPTLEPKTLKQSKQKKPKPEKKLSPKKQEKLRKKKEYEEALNGQEWNAKIIAPKGVTVDPQLAKDRTILSVRHLKVFFQSGEYKTKAVHDVSFDVKEGETFGIVGESGCGKTTTGRSIIGLYKPTSGAIYYKSVRIAAGSRYNEKEIKWSKIHAKEEIKKWREDEHNELSDASDAPGEKEAIQARYDKKIAEKQKALDLHVKEQEALIKQIQYDNRHSSKKLRQQIQMIFQDPIDSLDPRMTVEDIICEGLHIQGLYNKKKNREIVAKVLERVGLIPEYASRYPHEFSGGQRQRIGIARALVMNPKILICDEPISALDVSIRAQVLNLLNEVKQDMNLTMLFIAHDLSVVKYFCDRIAVMYFGNMVELASSDELFLHPLHPYTQALLSAIPKPDPLSESSRERKIYNPSETHDYSVQKPTFREILPGHFVLCNDEEEKAYREKVAQIDRQPKEEEK